MGTVKLVRGLVVVLDFDPTVGHEQGGRRPALVVSSERLNPERSKIVTVLPITSQPRVLRSRIFVDAPEGGLRERSWIIGEQIRTISTLRIVDAWGAVTSKTLGNVDEVLRYLLGL